MYPYACECGFEREFLIGINDRDKTRLWCPGCRKWLRRRLTTAYLGKPVHRTQAILAGGKKVSGDWEKVK